MEIKIEQIAIATHSQEQAAKLIENFKKLGFTEWSKDMVTAEGTVFDEPVVNVAELNFNYQLGFELEILAYVAGGNWHTARSEEMEFPFQSHIGMHVTKEEMHQWKVKMDALDIKIAQEVYTVSHTNPAVTEAKKKYHYVVFDSKDMLGVDLKLIERITE